jgi:proteasome accessory factor A
MENPIDYIWVSQVYGVIPDPTVRFQLSQRADHILKTVASRVRFNRAMINPKWEHFYSHEGTTRLHLLFGEANQNEFAYALKIGATSLAICLLEHGLTPSPVLANPLKALRDVSRDESHRWMVELEDGSQIGAIDLQRLYLEAAQRFRGESEQTDWVLQAWESTLDGLERDPMEMGGRIDWVAKRRIVEMYLEDQGLDWNSDALHSIDLEYHNLDPDQSLFHAWQQTGRAERVVGEAAIVGAITDPPSDTRAKGRGLLVEKVLRRKSARFYLFDWNGVALDRNTYVEMPDPYETYAGSD